MVKSNFGSESYMQNSRKINQMLIIIKNDFKKSSSETAMHLIVELEGTENRIATAIKKLNKKTKDFNRKLREFGGIVHNSITGKNWETKPYFKAEPSSKKAPKIKFN